MFARSILQGRAGSPARYLGVGVTVVALSLSSARLLLAQEDHGAAAGGGGLFDINWAGLMFWTWLIFIVLLLVLRKWAWGPILGALEAREKRIQDTLDGAARDRDEAKALLEEQRQALAETRDQAIEVLRLEAVDLSILAASRVLHKNLDSDENRRLVDDYLDSLAAESQDGGN